MLTGDALPIAREIAKDIGLGEHVIRISDIRKLSEQDAAKATELVEENDGFAEVYPEDKYIIVKSLQAKGHVVGMTGDGVNDAPALRQAEVGIAVSSATDVAKAASSVVLTAEGLSNIVDLVKTGRMTYERIATWVVNKISRTILKSSIIVVAFLVFGKYVTSASAMTLLVFMTDFVKLALSTDNVRLSRKPDIWNVSALTKIAAILGLAMVFESFGLILVGSRLYNVLSDDPHLYTFTFETLFFFAIFSVLVVKERGHFWESMPSRTLLTAILFDMLIAVVIATVGIPGLQAIPIIETAAVIAFSVVFSLVVNDTIKLGLLKKYGTGW